MKKTFDGYGMIKVYDDVLTEDFCNHIINKFEGDIRSKPGIVSGGFHPDIKNSLDLCFSPFEDWQEEDRIFHKSIGDYLQTYRNDLATTWPELLPDCGALIYPASDTGYQIQKTTPTESKLGYIWHEDSAGVAPSESAGTPNFHSRVITFIWYLNDTKGGHTEFIGGLKVKPKRGRLLMFPATWTYYHRGHAPKKGNKYLCTGWIDVESAIENR